MEQQALGFNYRITDLQCALGLLAAGQARALRRRPQRDRRPLPRRSGRDRRAAAAAGARPRAPSTPTTCSSSRCRAPRALRRAARARHLRPGPLPAGLPAPLVPGHLRLRARAVPGRRGLLRGLPVAAVLPGPDRGRAGHGHRGRARRASWSRRRDAGSSFQVFDPGADVGVEAGTERCVPRLQQFGGEFGEPALDEVQPRAAGGGEVQQEAGVREQPSFGSPASCVWCCCRARCGRRGRAGPHDR